MASTNIPFDHLFSYRNCELSILGVLLFDNITLKTQIGKYPVGTKFPRATLDPKYGKLTLCDKSLGNRAYIPANEQHEFKLQFNIIN